MLLNLAPALPTTNFPPHFNPWTCKEFSERILFIGGIPIDCSFQELHEFLSKFDTVLWQRIEVDKFTGIGRGFAYAILATEEGKKAMLEKKGLKMRNLQIGVSIWQPKSEYLSKKDQNMAKKIFIKRISPFCSEKDLETYFSSFGKVEKAVVLRNHHDNSSRKIGFVYFETEEAAQKSLECSSHMLHGREFSVKKCLNVNETKKERSMAEDSDRHRSYTHSEESMHSHSQHDWSFFSQKPIIPPFFPEKVLQNNSFSLNELEDQPSLNISNLGGNNESNSKLANTSNSELWQPGLALIREEDETQETFPGPINSKLEEFEPDAENIFTADHKYLRVEVKIAYYTFPGYV